MTASARTLFLLLVAVCLALPMAGVAGAPRAEAATRPCPSRVVLKVCVSPASTGAIAPRGTAATDAPCPGKAIGTLSPTLAAPAVSAPLAFEVASASWSTWLPPTPARPPRS